MVVRMRHTSGHTANRRSHHALKTQALSVCAQCGAKHRPHHMCLECGFYKGRMVMDMQAKKKARAARMEARKSAIAEQNPFAAEETNTEAAETKTETEASAKKVKKTKAKKAE
ncbi:MAG: 50S ribosomal protein L32 [Patescibacteria group bacterium]